jgi:hypothetical protein
MDAHRSQERLEWLAESPPVRASIVARVELHALVMSSSHATLTGGLMAITVSSPARGDRLLTLHRCHPCQRGE